MTTFIQVLLRKKTEVGGEEGGEEGAGPSWHPRQCQVEPTVLLNKFWNILHDPFLDKFLKVPYFDLVSSF